MSHLWSERLCIALMPDRLAWVVLGRGLGSRIREYGSTPVSASLEGVPWHAALEVLQRELPNMPVVRGSVSVVLSNAFARYLVIKSATPMNEDVERLALARHDFRKTHGSLADGWEIRIAPGEKNYLAVAQDGELLAQLRLCFSATALKLNSVRPYAVAAFDHWVRCFADEGVEGLFLAEPHGYCYVRVSNGSWDFVRYGRWEGEPANHYRRVVQREALRSGSEERCMWLVPPLEASWAEEVADRKNMKQLPLASVMRDMRKPEYVMALLGAM